MLRNLTVLLIFALLFQAPVSLASNGLSAEDRLKSCDPGIAVDAAKEIVNSPASLKEPLLLFPPAAVLFRHGLKDEGLFWFYAAQLRVRYQLAFEKGDRGQLLVVMLMTTGPPIMNYALQDVSNFVRILDRVLEWDKTTPNPFREKPRSEAMDKQLEQVYAGFRRLKAKLISDKVDLEDKARKAAPEIERTYMQKDDPRCGKGRLDPAYARQGRKKEWSLVIEFVKKNKEVIQEAGGIKDVYPASSTKGPREVMPHRYEVSVTGNGGKITYPIVGVSRSGGNVKFSLECISHVSMGYREAFKDVCSQ